MKTFDPAELPFPETHRVLLSGVAPRPIAFVATQDKEGRTNLSPFSFFNAFGVNPPIVCFSPAFSGKTGAPKDSLLNILETEECTISINSYEMVHQASLASPPYERGIDEFEKSGFTKLPSVKVKAPGVAESPFVMEAKLVKHVEFGGKPGSANMLICEVLLIHVKDEVFDEKGSIDPRKMDQVARMGGSWYTRAAEGLFSWPQPSKPLLGIDRLPESIKTSSVLTGSDLALLAGLEELPEGAHNLSGDIDEERHKKAKGYLLNNEIDKAWSALID